MPRHAKGPRLWLRPARPGAASAWFVLDGTKQRGTGLGVGASEHEKEAALKTYLDAKHVQVISTIGSRDPALIPIGDVLTKYYVDKIADRLEKVEPTVEAITAALAAGKPAPKAKWKQADGGTGAIESRLRIMALRGFWKTKTLSGVNGDSCRAYAATRTPGAARRELEDFRAAINHHRREGLHDRIVSVVLPEKPEPREDYLTKGEAAALILRAWRYREVQNFRATKLHTRRHAARFMVVARYMGSRAAVICEASIEPKRPPGRAWINLLTGMFYGLPSGKKKTKKRRQLVKVPLPLLAHLRRWARAGQRYVVEWNGEPILKIRKAHDAVVAACEDVLGRHVSPHIWRHSVATWLMQDGAEPFKAAGFLAMSVETLLRVYGHHHPDHSADVHKSIRKRAAA